MQFDNHDVSGNEVRLRPFSKEHITHTYLDWLNDKERMQYSRQRNEDHSYESALAYLETFRGSFNHFWAIERISDDRHLGTMTTYVDATNGTADLGIMVGRAASGRGCGTEAWGLALGHAFEILKLRKVTGGTAAGNRPMIQIFERWGMIREGVQRDQERVAEGVVDTFLYGLLRVEWEAQSAK